MRIAAPTRDTSNTAGQSILPPMTPRSHANLDITRPLRNRLREHDEEVASTLGDHTNVGKIPSGVASYQVDGHAGGRGAVRDETRDDVANLRVSDPRMGRGVNR